jgi:hypothetical protein
MKPRGRMKIPITLKIDHNKKVLFESTKPIHGKTFTDALDESITNYLSDIVPADLLELEIQQTEDILKELRENLVKLRMVQEQTPTNEHKADDTYLKQFRDDKFTESKKSIITQINNNSISWNTIMNVFMFKNKKETQIWILKKIKESEQ